MLQGEGSGLFQHGGSYVTLTDGTDFSIVMEKMTWAHSQWLVEIFFPTENDAAIDVIII